MIQSPPQEYEFKVQVRHQVRDEEPEIARFFKGIFWMTLNDFVNLIFIPSFPRDKENWSLNIPTSLEDVSSLDEARQFTAALSEYTITPSDKRAGQQELIPIPPPPDISFPGLRPDHKTEESKTGVMFYVTPQEFIRFSQELAVIEEHTFMLYEYLPFEEVKEFECIQFITDTIIRSPHFTQKDMKMVKLPWYTRVLRPHTVKMNKIERLEPSEDDDNEVLSSQEEEFALQHV